MIRMCAGRQRRTFATVNDAGRRVLTAAATALAGPISFIALVAHTLPAASVAPLAGG